MPHVRHSSRLTKHLRSLILLFIALGLSLLLGNSKTRAIITLSDISNFNSYLNANVQSGLDSGPWPTQDHDNRRSNQSAFSGPASPGTPRLIYDAGSPILNELVATSDGKLVLGGFSDQVVANRVVAIDTAGNPVWPAPYTLLANNNESPIGFTAASGRIYVATHDSPDIPGAVSVHLYAILPDGTSAPNWPISIFPALYEPPAIATDGTIYQMDELTTLRALRPSDGSVAWQQSFCCFGQGAIALDSDGNLYAGADGDFFGSSGLWSWSPSGTPRWTALNGIGGALLDKLFNTPAISPANTIYVASLSGTVYAFNANGALLPGWPFATGSPVPPDSQRDPLAVGSSGVVYMKTVSSVVAIKPNGMQNWSFSPGGDGSVSPVVILDKDENVYFAFGNTIYSLTSSGAFRWSVPLNAPGRLYIGASGVLYVISAHQRLYAIAPFDICLQDDGNGNMLQFNSLTGDYQFTSCSTGLTLTGRGTVDKSISCLIALQDNKTDRNIFVSLTTCANRGSGFVVSQGTRFPIKDSDTTTNTCKCVLFLHPIEPWVQSGFGFADDWKVNIGGKDCFTTPACDSNGPRRFKHVGFDAKGSSGTSVRAAGDGVVSFVLRNTSDEFAGAIVLEHDLDGNPNTTSDKVTTLYIHVDPMVKKGVNVKQGAVIAKVATLQGGPHLHFGFRRAPFSQNDPSASLRGALPPEGTINCLPCFSQPALLPAFPDKWENPQTLFNP